MLSINEIVAKYAISKKKARELVKDLPYQTDPTRKLPGKPPRLYDEQAIEESIRR
jgi:hypothetical protein